MIVCVCHRVSDRDIARAAREGCASFDELQLELGVATSCGACHDCAHQTFHQHCAESAQPAGAVATAPIYLTRRAVPARHEPAATG